MGCLQSLFGGGAGDQAAAAADAPASSQKKVVLSRKFRGSKVSCEGDMVSGVGTVIAEAPLHQDRVYWEVTIVDLPAGADFALGVARKCVPPQKDGAQASSTSAFYEAPLGANAGMSWGLGREAVAAAKPGLKAGDTIGVVYDQGTGMPCVELFHKVGAASEPLSRDAVVKGVSGLVHPAVSVAGGAVLKVNLASAEQDFQCPMPRGADGIILARGMV